MAMFVEFKCNNDDVVYINPVQVSRVTKHDKYEHLTHIQLNGSHNTVKCSVDEVLRKLSGGDSMSPQDIARQLVPTMKKELFVNDRDTSTKKTTNRKK